MTTQLSPAQSQSPKAVVEEFWKVDANGARLTDAGWKATDKFFVRPIAPPKEKVICVYAHGFGVSSPKIENDKAEVIVDTPGKVWKIDPKMQLATCGSDQPKQFWLHKLVLTSKHWEFARDRRNLREVTVAPEWRFESESSYLYVTVETAVQYLSQVRDVTNDPVIRENAERSLKTLRHGD